MTKLYIKIVFIFFSTLLISSCDLDRFPKHTIAVDEAYKDFVDAKYHYRGLYPSFRLANYGNLSTFADLQTDLVNAVRTYGNRGGALYTWSTGNLEIDNYIGDYYRFNYSGIKDVNVFLDNIDKIDVSVKDPEQNVIHDSTIAYFKGVAFLMRAVYYHNLVLRFAKDYEPNTASMELGLAMPLTYNLSEKPSRKNLQETYDQIWADLAKAESLLPDDESLLEEYQDPIFLKKDYLYAVKSRVALYMHKFQDAIDACNKIIPKYALVNTEEALRRMWINDESSEILQTLYVSMQEGVLTGQRFIYNLPVGDDIIYTPDFIPTKKVLDAYEESDIRKNVFFVEKTLTVETSKFENIFFYNKYAGNPKFDVRPPLSSYRNAPKLFCISEAYLIKAEAEANLNRPADAIASINTLRVARGASILTSGIDALKAVQDEYLREMCVQGRRLDDLKRWKQGFNERIPQDNAKSVVSTEKGATDLVITPDNKAFVWEIPDNDLQANPNLKRNWQ